ncbi:helix-turn-helix domain-containing protein [Streptomyces sp. JJ38]|uniref:helix-turn-helix domain-containing protein n=1 Tax=Streptomyces sp. JJ38 TaxID=2738128 RepID=UPI00214A8E09|nr:helix-turn-helix domain-containing protein [Streptomyces sp. JJ38]MBW1597936.1 helix-turn-helix domain-containing protein [Streptomyces sp. JJ38]
MPSAPATGLPGSGAEAARSRLYRPEEIAEVLGCSAWWVKDRARRRLIPHTRVGRAYRFTADHLAEIVRLYEERPTLPPRAVAAVAGPVSMSAPQAGPPRPRRSPGTSAPRLRARPPRRTQYDTVA